MATTGCCGVHKDKDSMFFITAVVMIYHCHDLTNGRVLRVCNGMDDVRYTAKLLAVYHCHALTYALDHGGNNVWLGVCPEC